MPETTQEILDAALAVAPRVGLAVVGLAVGWLVARLARRLFDRLLRALRFDEAAERSGIDAFLVRGGVRLTARSIVTGLLFWTLLGVAAASCFSLLGVLEARAVVVGIFTFGLRALVAAVIVTFGIAAASRPAATVTAA
jgi:hypothetical protein